MSVIKTLIAILAIFIVWSSCVYNGVKPEATELTIDLRWVKAYPAEDKDKITTGVMWGLSYLGASLPKGSINRAIYWKANNTFTLDIGGAGFSEASLDKWAALLDALRNSEEYKRNGGIDLGRFMTLTLNSTNHYYAITGAHTTLESFRAQYRFDPKKAAIIQSTIAFGTRVIEISNTDNQFSKIAFIAAEGTGSVPEHTFSEEEFEAMDLMPNGQLRFALYTREGKLKTSASPSLTNAGKPAKCFWCHETHLIAPFEDYPSTQGYYTREEFTSIVAGRVKLIEDYRKELDSDLDFARTSDHTQAELLYISFMEPSAERLALEWGITVDEVKQKIKDAKIHTHKEFSFLGEALYSRKDIDHLAPYSVIGVPDDARDFSSNEPAIIEP
jgi:hypothetical protein